MTTRLTTRRAIASTLEDHLNETSHGSDVSSEWNANNMPFSTRSPWKLSVGVHDELVIVAQVQPNLHLEFYR